LIHPPPPPLSISISSKIGIRAGSFGNNLTAKRKISKEHMAIQDDFLFMTMDTKPTNKEKEDNQKEKSDS
jgi:hypothetical protein